MGNKVVTFTDQQLEDYQDCTFFTRKDILRVHKRFRETSPELVPEVMTEGQATSIQVPRERIEKMPELVENPFKGRICEAFSRQGDGNLTFEDFLDLLSVFSEQAPRDIKVFYAFKIYGELCVGFTFKFAVIIFFPVIFKIALILVSLCSNFGIKSRIRLKMARNT